MRALNDVPEERRCNATTRAGTPCKKWAERGRTRCKFHGGKSRAGWAHPGYVDGRYSTDLVSRWGWARIRGRRDARDRLYQRLRALGWDDAKAAGAAWEQVPYWPEEARL